MPASDPVDTRSDDTRSDDTRAAGPRGSGVRDLAATSSDPARADTTRARILDAAHDCIGRVGLSKTTLEDIARVAGCSRATLYRYFENKDALLVASVVSGVDALRPAARAAAAETADVGEALTHLLVVVGEHLEHDEALQFILRNEPESILPFLAFDGLAPVLAVGRDFVVETLGAHLDGVDGARFGEWVTRVALSYLLSPPDGFRLGDPASARALVEQFLVPALAPPPVRALVPEVL